jgi:hypothetical protein
VFPIAIPAPLNDMDLRVFELFSKMIGDVPAQGVLKALDIECEMLKSDVENNRLPLPEDAFSIFYFREFVHAIRIGRTLISRRPLPAGHVKFFRETIVRLVQADELPQAAVERFDHAFVSDVP